MLLKTELSPLNVVACFPDKHNWEVLGALFPGENTSSFIRMINLLGFKPQDSYPIRAAAIATKYLKLKGPTVLLGRRVGLAFGLLGQEYFEWVGHDEAELVIVPSFNRSDPWWKEEDNLDQMSDFFQHLADELRVNVAF